MIEILKASEEHHEYLCNTLQKTFIFHNEIDDFYAATMSNDDLEKFIETQNLSFVAIDEGLLVGAIIGNSILNPGDRSVPYANLRNIWVEETARGNGVANLLVTALETEAKKNGCIYVDLHVDTRNTLAQALWDKTNFITYQERRRKKLT
jgi:ribosomal protein S18 acetylase RimI-like enzyme